MQKQRLFHLNGKLTDDTKTLIECGVKHGDMLTLMIKLIDDIQINLQTQDGKIFILNVLPTDIIENVKIGMKNKAELPFDQQILILDGQELTNDKTLLEYNIVNKSTLYLFLKPINLKEGPLLKFPIRIKTPTGKFLTIETSLYVLVESLKKTLEKLENIHFQNQILHHKGN